MLSLFKKYKFWFFLSIIFIVLRLPSLFEPYWYGDEGIYLVLGQAIRRGLTLYSQIHDNKPPLLYYLAAISQTVFGFRLLLSLVMIPTIFFFYRLSLKFFSSKTGRFLTFVFLILSSIPFIEGNIANAEVFMLLPTILAFVFFLSAKKDIDYFYSGLLLGLAFTIKVPVFIEFIFLFLWIIISNLKKIKKHFWSIFFKLFSFGIAFLIPILVWAVYFTFKGALPEFLHAALLQNFSYLSSWATGTHTASASSGGLTTRLLLLFIFWAIVFVFKLKKIISSQLAFILFWFAATIFGALLSTRPYPHYLIQVLVPLCFLLPFLFNFHKFKPQIIVFASLIIFISILQKYKFYFYPNISYYKNFYSFQGIDKFHRSFGGNIESIYQISGYIKNNTDPNDKIFIWGDHPYIYALSDRLPPGRYTVAYHIKDFDGYQETIESFKTHPPKFIIYYPDSDFPQLMDFISHYYFLDKTFGSAFVFKIR